MWQPSTHPSAIITPAHHRRRRRPASLDPPLSFSLRGLRNAHRGERDRGGVCQFEGTWAGRGEVVCKKGGGGQALLLCVCVCLGPCWGGGAVPLPPCRANDASIVSKASTALAARRAHAAGQEGGVSGKRVGIRSVVMFSLAASLLKDIRPRQGHLPYPPPPSLLRPIARAVQAGSARAQRSRRQRRRQRRRHRQVGARAHCLPNQEQRARIDEGEEACRRRRKGGRRRRAAARWLV